MDRGLRSSRARENCRRGWAQPKSLAEICWITAFPFPVGSHDSLCYARYWLIGLGLEKTTPWSQGWKKANLSLGRALGQTWLLPPDSWGRCHPLPGQIQRDWSTSQQFLLLTDHTSEKNLILFLLLEGAGLWPAGLRAGALALVGYPKLWVLVKPLWRAWGTQISWSFLEVICLAVKVYSH